VLSLRRLLQALIRKFFAMHGFGVALYQSTTSEPRAATRHLTGIRQSTLNMP
jgi:hypothetical protein